MSKTDPIVHPTPPEMLTEWEGPAVHDPGVLFEEAQADHLSGEGDPTALASWIAVAALSGVIGNSAYEAVKAKIVGVLSGWRRRFGQAKIDEVKLHLLKQMQNYRNNRKITDEELRERIELLFFEIRH